MKRALLLLIVALAACRKPAPPATASTTDASWEKLPSRDKYAGSESCRDCHEKNYDRWSHDWHARALAKATPQSVVGSFANAHYKGESSEAWMSSRGDAYVMRTRNRDGQLVDYPVEWVIGAKRMQDTATVFPDGRWQVLPVYYHVTGNGAWVDYNESKQGKVTPDHPYFWTNFKRAANKECLECHATGVDVRYDRAAHSWSTSFADAGVACEACHGPGARHAETKAKSDIFRSPTNAMDVCARCHGPREPLFPLLVSSEQFRPGEHYTDRYEPLVVVDGTERSGEYFADGRPSSSSFEYQAVLQSRCFRSGGAVCLSCHTPPHAEHAANEVKPGFTCNECHRDIDASHAHHAKATCVDCHMPRQVSGVLDKFADHTIDVPNPANTMRHGVPNACAQCHADKSAAALQQAIERWWPDAAQRQARRIRLADAIDEKTREQSLPALLAVLADRDEAPTLRGACAVLLGQRFPQEASRALVPLLADANAQLRAKALEALGYARTREAADAIAPLMTDPSIEVRQLAALVLASFGDARGSSALEKLATDPSTRALVRPHIMLGLAAANRGDYDAANRELQFAVDEVPYAVDALVLLGDIAARRGDWPAARKWFEEALRFDPGHRGAKGRMLALGKR